MKTDRKSSAAGAAGSEKVFFVVLGIVAGTYALLLVLLVAADFLFLLRSAAEKSETWWGVLTANPIIDAFRDPAIRYSIVLTLVSCTVAALLSVVVAIPTAYLLSRHRFPGKRWVEAIFDIPIVLPPLVLGLSLLILFQFAPFSLLSRWVVYQVPAVVLAQFTVAAAFAVHALRAAFDQTDSRCENVALTLGCSRWQAFHLVVIPDLKRGILTAGTLAWARSLGEFGPLLIFAGATRHKTEVLSTTVFLEISIGDLDAAVAVSLIMIGAALAVLMTTRILGGGRIRL